MLLRMRKTIICLLLLFLTASLFLPVQTFATASDTITLNGRANENNVTLKWNEITHSKGVSGYYIFRATSSGKQTNLPETDFWIEETRYVDTKVEPGTTYYYIVRPVLSDGTLGRASNEKEIYYKGPTQDIKLRVTEDDGNIKLQWKVTGHTDDIVGYYVYRSTKSGKQSDVPETDFWIEGTTYTDKKAVPGTTYYYIVRPVYENNTIGEPSNEVEATCKRKYCTISMTIGNRLMLVNGKYKEIDPGQNTVPVVVDGRTMLPIRAIIEEMGGTADYSYKDKKIIIECRGKTINLWLGEKVITVDSVKKEMDVAPYISDTNRTMVPLRFVIENLGCDIVWDGGTLTATIIYPDNEDYHDGEDEQDSDGIWEGTWLTNKGRLILDQDGNYVTGKYGKNHTLEGTVKDNKLVGKYNENGTIKDFEFTMASDGQSFDGIYEYKNKPKKHWLEWDGKREIDPLAKYLRKLSSPADFSGNWSTEIGRLTIYQKGNQVTGTYGRYGSIYGNVTDNKLTATYKQGRESGVIEIYLLKDNENIKGHYGSSDTPRQDWKQFDGKKDH